MASIQLRCQISDVSFDIIIVDDFVHLIPLIRMTLRRILSQVQHDKIINSAAAIVVRVHGFGNVAFP
jgi:hypothetical protein